MNQRRKARNTENDLQYGEEGRMTGQFFSRSELKLDQNGPRARTHSGGGGEQTQTAARKKLLAKTTRHKCCKDSIVGWNKTPQEYH